MAGGMFGGPHPVARKFNAGQKMIYWIAVGGGGLLVLSGVGLMLPFWFTDILGMQIIQVTHSLIAALMIAVIIGHIYLGTVGVRGSFSAMATGRVDLNWAREHHWLWVEEEVAKGSVEPEALYPAE
jgi:formate dehydrogenase subunit gamma